MAADVQKLVEQVKALPPEEQRRFQELLQAGQVTEDEFKQLLLEKGLIRQIRASGKTNSRQPRVRVDIDGEPLSETVIEERK